jgi:uncharacterized protein
MSVEIRESLVGTSAAPTRRFGLISADGHLNEPGDVWTQRLEKKYQERAPRIESFPEGDAWVVEGVDMPLPFGWRTCAGKRPDQMHDWARVDEISPGNYEPKARLRDLDLDRTDAEVLFPGTPVIAVTGTKEPDFHHAQVRAYNDWISEFCSVAPDRLGGTVLLPNRGVAEAVAEVERTADMPGFVGFLLKCYPHGDTTLSKEDDALWTAIEETGKPITIHVSLGDALPKKGAVTSLPGTGHFYDAPRRMLELIFSGVLDRFPGLTFVLTEVDCGWVPYFLRQADDNYLRHAHADLLNVGIDRLPSQYIADHFAFTFITDSFALENRHAIGVERMLWSSDYPHITSDWPFSWRTINASFENVPEEERRLILADNAERIFRFPA